MTSPVKESSSPATAGPTPARSMMPSPALTHERSNPSSVCAMLTLDGRIVAVDERASTVMTGHILHAMQAGANYFKQLQPATEASNVARQALLGIESVAKGRKSSFTMDYSVASSSGLRFFRLCAARLTYQEARVCVTHSDITDLKLAGNRRLQKVIRRLIELQDSETESIAQGLHDEVGNRIALIAFGMRQKMKQDRKRLHSGDRELENVLSQLTELSSALADLSHFLYPPSLRYAGIGAALKTLRDSMQRKHGTNIQLVVPAQLPVLSAAAQLAIFRIAQRTIQTIVSRSTTERICLNVEVTAGWLRLIISDAGKAVHQREASEVEDIGLLCMEERAASVGGHLSVQLSARHGTEIILTVPTAGNPAIETTQPAI